MKIKLSSFCWDCFYETDGSQEEYERLKKEIGDEDISVEFNDENIYQLECAKGHIRYTHLQNEKFELLFDMAAMALLDGYTKECVSTIASSFERFIEFYIKVIAVKRKSEFNNFINTWKLLSKQSERQLGSFYMLQLFEYNETKYIVKEKWITFRNKVIHQGYVPTQKETLEYGEYILNLITSILINFKNNDDVEHIYMAQHFNITKKGEVFKQNGVGVQSIPTIISLRTLTDSEYGKISFLEAVRSIPNNGFYKHFYSRKFNNI